MERQMTFDKNVNSWIISKTHPGVHDLELLKWKSAEKQPCVKRNFVSLIMEGICKGLRNYLSRKAWKGKEREHCSFSLISIKCLGLRFRDEHFLTCVPETYPEIFWDLTCTQNKPVVDFLLKPAIESFNLPFLANDNVKLWSNFNQSDHTTEKL